MITRQTIGVLLIPFIILLGIMIYIPSTQLMYLPTDPMKCSDTSTVKDCVKAIYMKLYSDQIINTTHSVTIALCGSFIGAVLAILFQNYVNKSNIDSSPKMEKNYNNKNSTILLLILGFVISVGMILTNIDNIKLEIINPIIASILAVWLGIFAIILALMRHKCKKCDL